MHLRSTLRLFALTSGILACGCGSTCDDLISTLADCVGDVGATETNDTANERTNDVCDSDEEACASCILASKRDLCAEYGTALAECRESGECAP
jgi:hypothetical protein